MRITLIDQFPDKLPGLTEVTRAIQAQIREHFAPIWGADASLHVVRLPESATHAGRLAPSLPHSDGIVYLSPSHTRDKSGHAPPVAYHFKNHAGLPCGFVFPGLAASGGPPWSVALSHEILEMLVDPHLNLCVAGPQPDPAKPRTTVLRTYEICDPVQTSSYLVGEVEVANFVTPQYFVRAPHRHGRHEAMHYLRDPELKAFGLLPGGYCSYFRAGKWHSYLAKGNESDKSDSAAHGRAVEWDVARKDSGAARSFRRLVSAYDGGDGDFPAADDPGTNGP